MTFQDGRSPLKGRLAAGAAAVAAFVAATVIMGTPAFAGVSPGDANALAAAIAAPGTTVTSASFVAAPTKFPPNGVGDSTIAGFPIEGSTFAILTTGKVESVPLPDVNGTSADLEGLPVRGNSDFDVSILKVDFTAAEGMNCVSFDFRFFSEEFTDFQDSPYNDAFIAELDTSDWDTVDSAITGDANFAFDSKGKPITIKPADGGTSMVIGPSDVTYDGATPVLTAATEIETPGSHSLYFSLFDQADHRFDSAVFIDNLVVGHAVDVSKQCAPGARPKQFTLTLVPPTATKTVGTTHTVTATVLEGLSGPVAGAAPILYAVTGANSATGSATSNGEGVSQFTYTGTTVGDDTIKACYDLNEDAACGPSEPNASVVATWISPAQPILAVTGSPTGKIAGIGVLCVVVGAMLVFFIRRRRIAGDEQQ